MSGTKIFERFGWTDTLFIETEKRVIEDMLFNYHILFARHRMGIGRNTEFEAKLTPKNDEAVYNQSLPKPIHLKEDLIFEVALMQKYGIITVLHFSKKRKSLICTEENQRFTTSSFGPHENQHPDCR